MPASLTICGPPPPLHAAIVVATSAKMVKTVATYSSFSCELTITLPILNDLLGALPICMVQSGSFPFA